MKEKQASKALNYIEKGIKITPKSDSSTHSSYCYLKGWAYDSDSNYTKALESYNEGYKLAINDTMMLCNLSSAITTIFIEFENADSVIKWANKNLEFSEYLGAPSNIAGSYLHLAYGYFKQKKYQLSNDQYFKAIKIFQEIEYFEPIATSYRSVAQNYKYLKDFEKAYEFEEKVTHINESLNSVERKESIAKLEIEYETYKKESQIKELDLISSRKSYFILFILAIVLIITILAYFLFNRFKTQKQNELLKIKLDEAEKSLELEKKASESEIKAIKSQMNPHFFYNALNSIQAFIYNGDKENAAKSLTIFSDLSRAVLESSRNSEISLFDELSLLENYLKLETMRLPKIKYIFNVNEKIPLHDTFIPPMILQPILENAINHGLANKSNDCLLQISFENIENYLEIKIDDNGIGRKLAAEFRNQMKKKSANFSSEANLNRIELLNANKDEKITQNIIDKLDENGNSLGTLVVLKIPLDFLD